MVVDAVFDWIIEVHNGKSADFIFFDLSKAFNMVDHSKLASKLEDYAFRAQLLTWLKLYP